MAAYDSLLHLVRCYFADLGYNENYLSDYFSERIFSELISIRLANANVMIKNKTDRSSHQTHIAITGEAIVFFYSENEFEKKDNATVEKMNVAVSVDNIKALKGIEFGVADTQDLELENGVVTVGKRTQKQVQLSKRNSENSECFNELRLGLYENDLLILLRYREADRFIAIGIPQIFYLDYIEDYAKQYETNTYLRLPRLFD